MHNLQPNSSTHRYTCKQSGYEVVDSQHWQYQYQL
jgi:hypothetical protein